MDYRRSLRGMLFVALITLPAITYARDLWVVLGSARGASNACDAVYTWTLDASLHNVGAESAHLDVLEMSNGGGPGGVKSDLPVQRSLSLARLLGDQVPRSVLFVAHLSVPDSVLAEGRLEYRYDFPCSTLPAALGPAGKGVFPVFTSLAAPLSAQRYFGSDLGNQKARINVGIYNDADVAATATIESRRPGCATAAPESSTVRIPAKTITQTTVPTPQICTATDPLMPEWEVATTVVVDQPSLSYVSVVSNQQPPVSSFSIGTTGK